MMSTSEEQDVDTMDISGILSGSDFRVRSV